MAVYKGASFNDSVNKLDVFEGANIRLTTTLATAEITTLNVSGEAYVGGKITMENNVNNKKLVLYEPATSRSINRINFTVLVLAEHSVIKFIPVLNFIDFTVVQLYKWKLEIKPSL
jgi:hypothetical protein